MFLLKFTRLNCISRLNFNTLYKSFNVAYYSSFKHLGIHPLICDNLKNEFGIVDATPAQKALIEGWLQDREIIFREITGSGKTFAITLVLLSQAQNSIEKNKIRGLFIVPNRELAIQIKNWCQKLLGRPDDRLFQVVYRGKEEESQQNATLSSTKPRLLIGTPSRIQELSEKQDSPINLEEINRVVLDEVDHLLRLPTRYAPLKKIRVRELHPKPTSILMERLVKPLQVAIMSATMNRGVRHHFKQMGWMRNPIFIEGNLHTPPASLEHMCVVVAQDSVSNLCFDKQKREEKKIDTEEGKDVLPESDVKLIECVGVAAHADKVKMGLLFIPNQAPLSSAISRLKQLGINAHPLRSHFQSRDQDQEQDQAQPVRNPKLLVGSYFDARGIDVPGVTHVYIVGFPGSVKDYLHIAGRAGRLAIDHSLNWGQILTFITEGANHPTRMSAIYKFMSIVPKSYPHIE